MIISSRQPFQDEICPGHNIDLWQDDRIILKPRKSIEQSVILGYAFFHIQLALAV